MIAPISGAGANATGRRFGGDNRRVEPIDAAERGSQQAPRHTPIAPERALVASQKDARREQTSARATQIYGDAAFLTHLIATREGLPQTRARRRAEPEQSAAAYATTARSTIHLSAGRILKHSA